MERVEPRHAARLGRAACTRRTPASRAGSAISTARIATTRRCTSRDCDPVGFRWLVGDDREASVARVHAHAASDGDPPVVVVANFTPVPREGYRVGVPRAGYWREVLNSDAEVYGGSGMGNRGGVTSEARRVARLRTVDRVTVPPLAIVLFVASRASVDVP